MRMIHNKPIGTLYELACSTWTVLGLSGIRPYSYSSCYKPSIDKYARRNKPRNRSQLEYIAMYGNTTRKYRTNTIRQKASSCRMMKRTIKNMAPSSEFGFSTLVQEIANSYDPDNDDIYYFERY